MEVRQGETGAFASFLSNGASVDEVYPGATGERLRQVKAVYDPKNIFCRNVNVR